MLRELIDVALLEDFAEGLARAGGLRVAVYDANNQLIAASLLLDERTGTVTPAAPELPPHPLQRSVPLDDGVPISLAFVEHLGSTYVVAPVVIIDEPVGFVAAADAASGRDGARGAEPRREEERRPLAPAAFSAAPATLVEYRAAAGEGQARAMPRAVVVVRWAARLLSAWCRRESLVHSAAEELALIGDIAELLTGEQSLQAIVNQIVQQTARVMKCRFCSMRLYDPKTDELRSVATYNLSEKYLNKGVLLRRQSSIDDQALRGEVTYIEDVATDQRFRYRTDAKREGIVSVLTAGMIYRGQPIGVLRVYTGRKQRFRNVQRNLLRAVASQAATAIVHARLVEERLRQAAIERQLQLAGKVQARMIPRAAPRHDAVEFARVYEPSSHVGGDFCDFLTLGDGRVAAVVADVAGKGVPASLLMASVRGALRVMSAAASDLGALLARLNQHVVRETSTAEFVTLLIVAVDRDGQRMGYANAGHEPPLLLRDGVAQPLDEGSLVLGLDPDETYCEHRVALRPDDAVLMYTDGAIDATDFEQHSFGRARLSASFAAHGGLPPATLLRNVLWDVRRFVGLAEQADDLTLVALRVGALRA
ncbi:MAG: PP2C family protein-serine/threonine phosphatase [Phycisphaerae bacterium]